MFHQRYISRLILIGITLAALSTASWAQGVIIRTDQITLDSQYGDFGSGTHGFGKPSGSGSARWEYSTSGGMLVAKATIKGTLYVDTKNFLGQAPTFPDWHYGARLRIAYLNSAGDLLSLAAKDVCCFTPFANENDTRSRIAINETFADPQLSFVTITVGGLVDGGEYGNHASANSPPSRADVKKYDVVINDGNNDFGGEPHALGSPVTSGLVQLERENYSGIWKYTGKVKGRVKGTLYWDALFGGGCTRLIIDFQDLNGTTLSQKTIDRCGTGGNANDAGNKLAVDQTFTSGSLMKIRLQVGTQDGSFRNVEAKTYGWN